MSRHHPFRRSFPRRGLALGVLCAALALPAASAHALAFTLDVELDDGLIGAYADVSVVEEDMGLRFEIALRDALGPGADLHSFYFNLVDGVPDLQIQSDDPVNTAYVLSQAPPVAGGAGSSFDWGVHFGNGAGPPGNGVLQSASFRIEPVDSGLTLALDALLNADPSLAAGGTILVDAVAHVQGTSLVAGSSSEAVGGMVPEPSTGLMLALGLTLVVGRRQRAGISSS